MNVIDELITHCEAWEPWARVMGNVCAGDAAQALRNLRAELANKDQILGDTLAVLCGDGGHYRAEHGDIKAKEHGLKRYHDLLVSEDGLRAELAACRAALELIAAPQRSDGSWNRDREACRQVAQAALAAKEE